MTSLLLYFTKYVNVYSCTDVSKSGLNILACVNQRNVGM